MEAFNVRKALFFLTRPPAACCRVLIAAISLKENKYQYCGSVELDIPVDRKEVAAAEWTFIDQFT